MTHRVLGRLLLLGGAIVIIGSLLPWHSVTGLGTTLNIDGIDSPNNGVVTLLAGIVVVVLGWRMVDFGDHPRRTVLVACVATAGLVSSILLGLRHRPNAIPALVASYIFAAYWFTASTSFANPAVTIARALTRSFAGRWSALGDDLPGWLAHYTVRRAADGERRISAAGPVQMALMQALRDHDIAFAGGSHGWPPAEVFADLRERGLVHGDFDELVFGHAGTVTIRRR